MAKLTPEFADRVRQICTDALPMQITRREVNQSFYDYVWPGQPLTDEEVIGISCGQRQGYLNSMCVVDERGIDCPRGEIFVGELKPREKNLALSHQ